jgi:Fe-S-cluster containining protein
MPMRLQIIDPKANFSCGGCTKCCNQPWAVVIEEEKAKRLDSHDFSAYPQLSGKTFYRKSKDAPEGYLVLSKQKGLKSCLFLDDDGLCIIHKELGAEAKPHPCLRFPYHVSTTYTDDRVSVDFGCPEAQQAKGIPLTKQKEDVQALVPPSMLPAKNDVQVPLTETTRIAHDEYEALMDRVDAIFAAPGDASIWSRFAETLALLTTVEKQKHDGAPDLLEQLLSGERLPETPDVPKIRPYENVPAAPSPVRMLFAATLLRDVLPLGINLNMSIWRRMLMLPKLMSLAKLCGSYESKLLGHEICIEDVFAHALEADLDPAATALLQRYFRTRFWQRFLVGTRLSVSAGIHQHIHDFSAIVFLARAEAQYRGESRLSEHLISQALSHVELAIANQPRTFDQQALAWFTGQLDSPTVALQSLRLMALPDARQAINAGAICKELSTE